MSEQIRREFTIPFSIAKVKKAIEDACSVSGNGIILAAKNPTFNTYTINIVKGLYVLPTTVSLREATPESTIFELSAIPGKNLSTMPGTTTAAIDGLLQKVGDFASGRLIIGKVTPEDVARQNRQAKNTLIFLVLGIAFIIFCFFYLKK